MPIYAQANMLDKKLARNLKYMDAILFHVLTGQKKVDIYYYNMGNLFLSVSNVTGSKRDKTKENDPNWNHAKFLDSKKGGFTRVMIHNIFHGICSMEMFGNLVNMSAVSFEACMSDDRFAVHYKRPGESNHEAIYRFEELKTTVLLLMASAGWNSQRTLCAAKNAVYKLPSLYRDQILKKYTKNNELNWMSKLIEYKWHPNSLELFCET